MIIIVVISIGCVVILSSVVRITDSSPLLTSFTIPTGVFGDLCRRMISEVFLSCQSLWELMGLYKTITKSASAAHFTRLSIISYGVSRSLRLMTA